MIATERLILRPWRMACDNMKVEQAISKLLPTISTVCVQNDSIARLDCAESSAYIVLRKANEKK